MLNKAFCFTLLCFSLVMPVFAKNYRVVPVIDSNDIPQRWEDSMGHSQPYHPPIPMSYIKGKICDINGKPLRRSVSLSSKNPRHSWPDGEKAYINSENGEYSIYVVYDVLPAFEDVFVHFYEGEYVKRSVYLKRNETVHLDFMLEEMPRIRPWWHFKYNTGKCDAPWPF
jgi:hypothetical protein